MQDKINHFIKYLISHIEYKTNKRQVIFLSDDWGTIRIKSEASQNELVQLGLKIRNRFDKFDSLETNDDLELLFDVLTKYKDHKGNHPVITAVTNLANPDFYKIQKFNFQEYYFESIEQSYQRYENSDNVLSLIKDGISNRIFMPQSHGREHVQINWWMEELQNPNGFARKFFNHEFFLLGPDYLAFNRRGRGLGASLDVWNKADIISHSKMIKSSLELFEKLFCYRASIFTPPAMFYHPENEIDMFNGGIKWLDVGRLFKTPSVGGGERYQFNYLGRLKNSNLKVLVRNGMFEPNLNANDNGVEKALKDIELSFALNQPAILSNHRAAFVGRISKNNQINGLNALDQLLKKIIKKWPDVEFISASELC